MTGDKTNVPNPHSSLDDALGDAIGDFWKLVDRVCERHGIPLQPAESAGGYESDGN